MLFTVVDAETKYKAKNVIDTAVYRGGDAGSGWVKAGIDALGFGARLAARVGAALAAVWAGVGYWLGRSHDAKQQGAFARLCKANPGILIGPLLARLCGL